MIGYVCNKCKKPIDMGKDYCAHIAVAFGKRGIKSRGSYGDGYDADLCEDCYKETFDKIVQYYYGGNEFLKGGDE